MRAAHGPHDHLISIDPPPRDVYFNYLPPTMAEWPEQDVGCEMAANILSILFYTRLQKPKFDKLK